MNDDLKQAVKKSRATRIAAALIMGFLGTIGTVVLALPYYLAHWMFINDDLWEDWQGWLLLLSWTWFLLSLAIGMMLYWMEIGAEKARKKKLDKLTSEN